jgi:hypothetical protein
MPPKAAVGASAGGTQTRRSFEQVAAIHCLRAKLSELLGFRTREQRRSVLYGLASLLHESQSTAYSGRSWRLLRVSGLRDLGPEPLHRTRSTRAGRSGSYDPNGSPRVRGQSLAQGRYVNRSTRGKIAGSQKHGSSSSRTASTSDPRDVS